MVIRDRGSVRAEESRDDICVYVHTYMHESVIINLNIFTINALKINI